MVGLGQIVYDIADIASSVVLVPLLWLFLFLFAWEDRAFARSVGFDRLAFWLLVPAVVLSFFAEVPLFPFAGNVIAINIGGALIPIVLSAVLFSRFAPPRARTVPWFVVLFGLEASAAFLAVVFLPASIGQTIAVVGIAAAVSIVAALLPTSIGVTRPLAAMVALTSGVLVVTFLISEPVPGEGILVYFPAYLVGPIAAGVFAAALGPYLFGEESGRALPLAYAATTFGVLIGADLLRQPPLYTSSQSGLLYVIGGANYSDLVYLSGILALALAYLMIRYREIVLPPVATSEPNDPPAPMHALAEAVRATVGGDPAIALERSRTASHAAAAQARILLDAPPAPEENPWTGLPVPGWIVADQANLDALVAAGTEDPAEVERTTQTARGLVGFGRYLSERRFASVRQRTIALAVDFAIVLVPAALLWGLLAQGASSGLSLTSLSYLTAAYGFIGFGFLYFAVLPALTGTSVGKWLVGLEVRDRRGQRVGILRSIVRECPKLIILSVVGVFGPLLVVAALHGASSNVFGPISTSVFLAIGIGVIGLSVAATGLVGGAVVLFSSERQRLGDHLAGTWVVRARLSPSGPAPAGGAAAAGSSGSMGS